MSERLQLLAPAKINLFLHIRDKRGDGYHTLQSLVCFADIGDAIIIENAEKFSFHMDGPFAHSISSGEDNLAVRAARMMEKNFERELNCSITLEKNLPVAAGIGGGSMDAAAVIKGLFQWWKIENYPADLGYELGADLPACLHGRSALIEGIGEILSPAPAFASLPCVLINPLQSCVTADVFRAHEGEFSEAVPMPRSFENYNAVIEFLAAQRNDLQNSALRVAPEITNCIAALKDTGCDLVRMSGSGATCFGLFDAKDKARQAEQEIRTSYPDWWVRVATLNS